MAPSRTLERVVLFSLVTLVAWDTWTLRRLDRTIDEQSERIVALDAKVKKLGEVRLPNLPATLPPELFQPRRAPDERPAGGAARGDADAPQASGGTIGAPPAAAPKRGKGKRDVPPVPGANVLSKLYDAADAMAAEERWSDETYDEVSLVFEDTTTTMTTLYKDLQAGRVNAGQAKEEALRIRDEATAALEGALGADGLERLKGYIREEGPVGPR